MKTLNRVLTAAFFALCLSMTALADLLPIPPRTGARKEPCRPRSDLRRPCDRGLRAVRDPPPPQTLRQRSTP